MNKADMVEGVSKFTGSRVEAQRIVDWLFTAMRDVMRKNEKVVVQGFGSFHVVMRKPKKGRNIKTGQEVLIPARPGIKFRKAKDFM
ncbi:MAG: HU family DNA-binding protein [Elusimicrobia bacterium]|nr:HU family DNA-binding protein [Candidatus Obscuribacterium magneticum]